MRRMLLAAGVALAALVLAPPAFPAAPTSGAGCWKSLLRDYADNGRIDDAYAASCYREAIRRMPTVLSSYSDAYDVLTRALASATAHPHRRKGVLFVAPPRQPPATGRDAPQPVEPAPFTRVANSFSSSEPDRVPLPLLVLAGLGVLFVAAGVAGAIVRRRRS